MGRTLRRAFRPNPGFRQRWGVRQYLSERTRCTQVPQLNSVRLRRRPPQAPVSPGTLHPPANWPRKLFRFWLWESFSACCHVLLKSLRDEYPQPTLLSSLASKCWLHALLHGCISKSAPCASGPLLSASWRYCLINIITESHEVVQFYTSLQDIEPISGVA